MLKGFFLTPAQSAETAVSAGGVGAEPPQLKQVTG
jgi:hypothetical protein